MFTRYMPHGSCYVWRPDILWLHVFSDIAIAVAYLSIPILLLYSLRKRVDVPFRGLVLMFCVFILACGLTHLMSIWVVWNGHYGAQGILKAITAMASVVTALMLLPHMPRIMTLRSAAELEELISSLSFEIKGREDSEAQRALLQDELAHMGRVSSMGQLATGLAHELNQPLTAITQYTDTAILTNQEPGNNSDEIQELLKDIDEEARRAAGIISALRQFIRKDESKREAVDLNELIDQTIQLVAPESRKASVKILPKAGRVPTVIVNRVQIAQVVLNLLRNSIQAISHSEVEWKNIVVSTTTQSDSIVVTVKDTGPGIKDPAGLISPFETTKPDGMGMGLPICQSIVNAHGGKIWINEAQTSGASISFSLPLKHEQ